MPPVTPPATAPATAPVLVIDDFIIFSREKSPHHKNAAITDHASVTIAIVSRSRQLAFQLHSMRSTHTIPAILVLYHSRRPAPARICKMVTTHDIVSPSTPKFLIQAQSNKAPAITRIIHKIFQYILIIIVK